MITGIQTDNGPTAWYSLLLHSGKTGGSWQEPWKIYSRIPQRSPLVLCCCLFGEEVVYVRSVFAGDSILYGGLQTLHRNYPLCRVQFSKTLIRHWCWTIKQLKERKQDRQSAFRWICRLYVGNIVPSVLLLWCLETAAKFQVSLTVVGVFWTPLVAWAFRPHEEALHLVIIFLLPLIAARNIDLFQLLHVLWL